MNTVEFKPYNARFNIFGQLQIMLCTYLYPCGNIGTYSAKSFYRSTLIYSKWQEAKTIQILTTGAIGHCVWWPKAIFIRFYDQKAIKWSLLKVQRKLILLIGIL